MRKFGLLGKKLSHSLSPLLHKVFFEEFGVEAEYKLYEVTETEIANFKSYMLENSIEGVNITVPYKKVFLDKLDFISDEAKAIGAINLLYIKDNKFYGDNTDYYGFKQTLISNQIKPSEKRIAIIGKGGANVDALRAKLNKLTGKQVHINIIEIKRPDLDAHLVGEGIARQLEQRVAFRRAQKQAIQRTMRAGAKGIKTQVSGRLGGADIARAEHYSEGSVPLHTLRADIDYAHEEADTTYGKLGVKVWINRGEVLPTRKSEKGGN